MAPLAEEPLAVQDAERWLIAAEMCYWAALEDYGAPELLRRGQEYLARLEDLAEPVAVKRRDDLQANIEAQLDMAHDTLRGVFPGYRVLREGIGPEVLVDDPWVVSTVNATEAASPFGAPSERTLRFDLRSGRSSSTAVTRGWRPPSRGPTSSTRPSTSSAATRGSGSIRSSNRNQQTGPMPCSRT